MERKVFNQRFILFFLLWILLWAMLTAIACSDSDGDDDDNNAGSDDDAGYYDDDDGYDDDYYDDDVADDDGYDDDVADDDCYDDDAFDDDTGDDDTFEPGQLTAGEWRDLDNWDFWRGLFEGQDNWDYMEDHWGFFTENRFAVVVMDGDSPAVDAKVVLYQNQDAIYKARTDNQGRAELFSNLFGEKTTGDFSIKASSGTAVQWVTDVTPTYDPPIQIDLSAQAPPDGLDLMFVIDTTGSMHDELHYLQVELEDVILHVTQNQQDIDIRLSVNFYRDIGDIYVVRPFSFTRNIQEALNRLAGQNASGGGDYEEAVEQALENAIFEHDWRDSARARLLFLVLDAPPHYRQQIVDSLHTSIEKAAEKGIRLLPIAASGVDKDTEFLLRFMDISTGGTYIFLTDHSGYGGSHLEPTIGPYQVELLNELLIRVIGEALAL